MDILSWYQKRLLGSQICKKESLSKVPFIDFSVLGSIPGGEVLLRKMVDLIDPLVLEELVKATRPPMKVGEKHPLHPDKYVGKMHADGLAWYATPSHATKIDSFIHENKQQLINKFDVEKQPLLNKLFDHVMGDYGRHWTKGTDRGDWKVRARHLKSALHGDPNVNIHMPTPDAIHFTLFERHGADPTPPGGNTWTFTSDGFKNQKKKDGFLKGESFEKMEILWCLQNFCEGAFTTKFTINKNETLNFLIKKKSLESYSRIFNSVQNLTISELKKAVKQGDWNRIQGSHREEHTDTVDHNHHVENQPFYDSYRKFLNDPKEQKAVKGLNNGISAKMIHEVPNALGSNDLVMAKPYHKNIESATKKWIKDGITGWATMSTKGLYDKVGIGHLCEDVGTHEHQGVPMTVHRFESGFDNGVGWHSKEISDGSRSVDPLQWKQIGVMDYLMNNLDRHHENLMIRENKNNEGIHDLLAIDHERNFQYHKNPSDMPWGGKFHGRDGVIPALQGDPKPHHFMNTRGYEPIVRQFKDWDKNDHIESDNKLASWWMQNRHNMKEELETHLGAIKDEHVRNHIRDNFHHRWEVMDDWADDATRFGSENLGSPHEVDFHGEAKLIPSNRPRNPRIDAIINKLPKDNPLEAIHSLVDHINQRKGVTGRQEDIVKDAVDHFVGKMEVNDLIKLINKSSQDPHYTSNKNIVPVRNIWTAGLQKIRNGSREDKLKFLSYYNSLDDNSQQKQKMHWWAYVMKNGLEVA